jgi:WD40 repeat protein
MSLFAGDPVIAPLGTIPGTAVEHIRTSPDGTRLVTAGSNGSTGIASILSTTGDLITSFGNQLAPVFTADYNPSGDKIATTSYDGTVAQWSSEGTPINKIQIEQAALCDAGYVGQSKLFVTSDNGFTSLWSTSGKEKNHYSSIGTSRAIAIAPNGSLLASASDTGAIHVFRRNGNHIRSFDTGDARINSLEFSGNSKNLLISTYNGFAKVYTTKGDQKVAVKATNGGITNQATYRPGHREFATAGEDGVVYFWSRSGEILSAAAMPGSDNGVGAQSLTFSRDGQQLFVATTDTSLWALS